MFWIVLAKRNACLFKRHRLYSTAITFNMLRPYQKDCINTSLAELKNGCHRQIVSLPVAHRNELLDQAYNQIKKYNPSLISIQNVQIEQGKRSSSLEGVDVVVGSVPTLGRANSPRIQKFDPSEFKAILIDEAHHAVASTYFNILDYFGVLNDDTDKLLWGCSATVKRHDGKALNAVFDKITFHVGFLEMIEQGFLSSMRVTTVKTDIDLSHVRSTKIDFVEKDLAPVINTDTRNEVIVSSWKKYAFEQDRKSTLVFALNIEHTIELCNKFLDAGINAKCITTILTEGTDIPCVDCILMTRPTRSATLFQQMFGRGLRLFPDKENCLVIDFVDNFTRTGAEGVVTVPTLLGLDSSVTEDADILELEELAEKEKKETIVENAQEIDPELVSLKVTEYNDLGELMIDMRTINEVRSTSSLNWVDVGKDKCILNIPKTGFIVLERTGNRWRGTYRREDVKRGFFPKPKEIPLETEDLLSAIRASETWMQENLKTNRSLMLRSAFFRKDKVTAPQLDALSRYKVQVSPNLTKGQAMDLLTKLKYGQLNVWKQEIKQAGKDAAVKQKRMDAAVLRRDNQSRINIH
ncbi:P-loop containing nucleoside triphosphate hydrolase protein [Blakeslea trispora]|nr:P-loop containing nucleoside triphosphate hydrolase protein [Blakeslea trispora]